MSCFPVSISSSCIKLMYSFKVALSSNCFHIKLKNNANICLYIYWCDLLRIYTKSGFGPRFHASQISLKFLFEVVHHERCMTNYGFFTKNLLCTEHVNVNCASMVWGYISSFPINHNFKIMIYKITNLWLVVKTSLII